MFRLKKKLIILIILIFIFPINTYASTNYATDDLRVLMGMYRLSEDESMKEIKNLLSICYRQNTWNELVTSLEDIEDIELKDFQMKEEAWYNAKENLEENFTQNKPIDMVLNNYIDYQTATSLRVDYTKTTSYELSLIDTSNIEEMIAYANSLLDATNDNTTIGEIGNEMKTFTMDKLLIAVPFGNSYSIDSGKKSLNEGIKIHIRQDNHIYSQFNGIVSEVTDNSVVIKTGKSIEIEYLNIIPSVEKKQKIKQYAVIGKTKTKTMVMKFKLNTVYADPLLLYGSRSIDWYRLWENANPGCAIDKKDYSGLLDNLAEAELEEKLQPNNAGLIISEDGITSKLIIQGENNYSDTPDNFTIEKIEPGIITDEK